MTTITSTTRPPFFRSISSSSSIKASKDKPRLYIALYPRGGSTLAFNNANCDSYHWSIIIGPQTASRKDPGTRYHVAHNHGPWGHWFYEEQEMSTSPVAQTVLIRVAVAKVTDMDRLRNVLRETPIDENDTAFNCLSWVKDAFLRLIEDGKCLKTYVNAEDWNAIDRCARKYCKRKREQRRFTDAEGPWELEKVSTFNFWENRETTP